MGEKKLLLGVDEVAEMLGIGDRKAREVMLALAHVRIGKLLKIRPEVIDRWINAHTAHRDLWDRRIVTTTIGMVIAHRSEATGLGSEAGSSFLLSS
jgi:fumarate reductase subunit D